MNIPYYIFSHTLYVLFPIIGLVLLILFTVKKFSKRVKTILLIIEILLGLSIIVGLIFLFVEMIPAIIITIAYGCIECTLVALTIILKKRAQEEIVYENGKIVYGNKKDYLKTLELMTLISAYVFFSLASILGVFIVYIELTFSLGGM